MTSCRRFPFLRLTLVFLGAVALSGLLWKLVAYQYYSDAGQLDGLGNCASCHELAVGGFVGRGALHDAHTTHATGTCRLCHTSTGDVPNLSSSGDPAGHGCIGCHGQPLSTGTSSGAGLRRHHALAGAPADQNGQKCVNCHASDPVPPPESTVPVYYARTDVIPKTPCNSDGKEDFWNRATGLSDGRGRGLDNDGNLLYDGNDPNPAAVETYNLIDDDCNGVVDEIQNVGFNNPANRQQLTWNAQPPTGQLYDIIRSDSPQFVATSPNSTCLVVGTTMTSFDDPVTPAARSVFYYLVRNTLVNDYGKDSKGNLRLYTLCP